MSTNSDEKIDIDHIKRMKWLMDNARVDGDIHLSCIHADRVYKRFEFGSYHLCKECFNLIMENNDEEM